MYAKRRTIPLSVSVWMDKDVSVRKVTASSGLMPDNTRYNVFLSRKFYSDMLELSSQRHRKIARFDYNRRMFLKDQRKKAETTMPGLLPYIEPFQEDQKEEQSSNRNDQFFSSTLQSMGTHLTNRSDSSNSSKNQAYKRNKPRKLPKRPQISLERINQLSQPRGHRPWDPTIKEHHPPSSLKPINVEELFGDLEDISYQNSFIRKEPIISTNDKRYRQLVHLFSNVYEQTPSTLPSMQSIIQSNTSLQIDPERLRMKNLPTLPPIRHGKQQDILNDSFNSETEVFEIETYT